MMTMNPCRRRRVALLTMMLALTACGGEASAPAPAATSRAQTATADGHAHDARDDHGVDDPGHRDAAAARDAPRQSDGTGVDHDADLHGDAADATTIPADIARESGIVTAPVGAGTIRDEHEVQGLLTTVEGRHARVVARFAGPVRAVSVGVGDRVRRGQTLATVESNVSLSTYAVTAPIGGTVIARQASTGDLAGDAPLFEIADLERLWVDLHLFGADAQHITPGLPVEVTRLSDGERAATTLDRVLPGTATASQSTVARATIANADGRWRPGAAVRARVTVAQTPVALRVPLSAVQQREGGDVVFVRDGVRYRSRSVRLGRRDGTHVEVVRGLRAGEDVVVAQSYLVKADIDKSGAAHGH